MGKRNSNSDATFYMPRESTYTIRRRLRGKDKTLASSAPTHFLPSFAIRRPLIKTEETEEFLKRARRVLPRNVEVGIDCGLTIIEQRKMIRQFREVGAEPQPDRVQEIATSIAHLLKESIKSSPRRLEVPMGRVFRFGTHNTKLGMVPTGWRGYTARYARRSETGERLAQSMFVREANVTLGGIAMAFSEESGNEREVKIADLGSETPHITFACRSSGGFSQAEERALSGPLEEILPEKISLFDPVIYLKLHQGQAEPIIINPRSPGEFRANGLVEF